MAKQLIYKLGICETIIILVVSSQNYLLHGLVGNLWAPNHALRSFQRVCQFSILKDQCK